MSRYNIIRFNGDLAFDFEHFRMESLIELREVYEEEFFSMEPPTVEMEYVNMKISSNLKTSILKRIYPIHFNWRI